MQHGAKCSVYSIQLDRFKGAYGREPNPSVDLKGGGNISTTATKLEMQHSERNNISTAATRLEVVSFRCRTGELSTTATKLEMLAATFRTGEHLYSGDKA